MRPSGISDAEWQTRLDLAACYRLIAHYRMTDLIYTHVSAERLTAAYKIAHPRA